MRHGSIGDAQFMYNKNTLINLNNFWIPGSQHCIVTNRDGMICFFAWCENTYVPINDQVCTLSCSDTVLESLLASFAAFLLIFSSWLILSCSSRCCKACDQQNFQVVLIKDYKHLTCHTHTRYHTHARYHTHRWYHTLKPHKQPCLHKLVKQKTTLI